MGKVAATVDTLLGRNLILWTVRLSVALYCYAVWLYLSKPRQEKATAEQYAKVWFSSWLLCVIHVACAYHFEHRWSQAAALKHTAEMTDRVVGWYWAGGLYVNYLFLLLWGRDVLRVCRSRTCSPIGMHLVAAFMMFNATVVFGPIWWGVPTAVFLGVLWLTIRSRRRVLADGELSEATQDDSE